MTAHTIEATHPVATTIAGARRDLRDLALRPLWSMDVRQTGEALVEVTRLAAQVAQLQLALLHQAAVVEVGAAVGATSAASWLAHETRTTRAATHRAARLARRLATAHPAVDIDLANGDLTLDQAQVIVDAVDALPDDLVDTDTSAKAVAFLLAEARHLDARALRVLGRRLLEVVDPEAADLEEARRLEQEEQAARAKASFTMSDDGHGRVHGRFTLPSLHGSMLRKHLMALAAPGRSPDVPAETPTRHKLGLALIQYVETRPLDSVAPERWSRGDGRGHDDRRVPARWTAGCRPVRRHSDLRRRGPAARLWCRHHPDGPRWRVRAARRRPAAPVPLPGDACRPRAARPGLHDRRL